MSKESVQVKSTGIGFFGLLAIVFITLKLTGYIAWSWWWVLAPVWMPATFVLGLLAFCGIIVILLDKKY